MGSRLLRKELVLGIILLFVGVSVIPSMGVNIIKRHCPDNVKITFKGINSRGYIQNLIDNASGGTIYIPSGIYYEHITINKSINLVGEDKDTTIIDGGGVGIVITIFSNWVNISGFTIQNSGNYCCDTGIQIFSNHSIIKGNNIISNQNDGISLDYSNDNIIKGNNIVSNNNNGINLHQSYNNTIGGNTISNNKVGIYLYHTSGNIIKGSNIISNNDYGIYLDYSSNNNIIYHNNFIKNTQNAYDENNNIWDDGKYGNYWSDYEEKYPDAKKLPFSGIWDTSYNISGGDNKDNYPLIKQWPKSKTISRNTPSYSYHLLRFLERFPILQRLLQRLEPQ